MSRSNTEILQDALNHLRIVLSHAERDLDDQLVVDAVCMRLSAAIETLAVLSPEVRNELFVSDWPLMWGMRNRIAHGYLLVDAEIVRATLRADVPLIVHRVQTALDEMAS